MKINFDYQIFSVQNYGGISRYICALSAELSLIAGVASRIVAPLYVNLYLRDDQSVQRAGVFIKPIRRTGRILRAISRLGFEIVTRIDAPDIIHETYYTRKPSGPKRVKRILTVHDMIHERMPESFPAGDKTAEIKKAAIERADHIICISEHTKRDLMDTLGVAEHRISVVLHGTHAFPVATGQAILPPPKRPYILHVGSRAGYKNFDSLLRAYGSSDWLKSNFDIVCFGGAGITDGERAIMAELQVDPKNLVHVSGSDAVLAQLYRQAAVFVYPSAYEGFGIPPLEAMSEGCPVVCSNASSIPEVVGEAGLYFDPFDTAQLQTAMETVLRSDETRANLIAAGHVRGAEFSWERCARETLAVYEKVLA